LAAVAKVKKGGGEVDASANIAANVSRLARAGMTKLGYARVSSDGQEGRDTLRYV
jgi:hypothetical protein